MAEPGDDRYGTGADQSGQGFAIKHGQVFAATAAAGQHNRFDPELASPLDHLGQEPADLRFHGTLHRDRYLVQAGAGPAFGCRAQHVGQGGAGHAGEQGDRRRKGWQGPFPLRGQQPLGLQDLAHPLELAQHGAEAGAQVQHLHRQGGPGRPKIELAHHHHAIAFGGLVAEFGQLGGPDHGRNGRLPIHQGEPEVTFLQLRPGDRGVDQESGGKAPLQQAADRLVQLGDAVAGQAVGLSHGRHSSRFR